MLSSRRVGRRRLLRFAALSPLAALVAACSGSSKAAAPPPKEPGLRLEEATPAPTATPVPPTPTPQPFVVAEGEQRRMMQAGTPQETPLYVYGSGRPGKVVMVLGGVHGNEPSGWLAAERLQTAFRPAQGAFLIIPRANKVATNAFERTLPSLGDLNRLYPGDAASSQPMSRMAAQIVDVLHEFHVDALLDMHESWAFYKDRQQNGTAFLGQTVATAPFEPGITLIHDIVTSVNGRLRSPQEELFDRQFPGPQQDGRNLPSSTPTPGPRPTGTSSLSLKRNVPGLIPILVEMGQQQALERRVQLHIDIFYELARRLQISDA